MPSKGKKGSGKQRSHSNGKHSNGAASATPRRRAPPLAVAAVVAAAAAVGAGYYMYDADASRADAALSCYERGDAACPNAPTCGVVVGLSECPRSSQQGHYA